MKKLLILSAAVALLASCSKDDKPAPKPGEVNSEITLALKGTLPPNSPAGNTSKGILPLPTQAADNTVNSIIVYVFNTTTQNLDQMKVASPAEITAKIVGVPASSGARDVYAVVNYASGDLAALQAVTNVAQLKAVLANLKNENEGTFSMIGKKLNQTISPAPAANNISVVVSRLAARVSLVSVTNNTGILGNFAIDSIYIINAIGTKSYGDSSIVVSPATIYNRTSAGMAFPLYDAFAVPVVVTSLVPYVSTAHYYVYANPATTYAGASKLVITGLLNGTRTYYPIGINIAGNGYTPVTPGIAANSQYAISMTISRYGNPVGPNYLDQIQPATASITVTPANWHTVINQSIDF